MYCPSCGAQVPEKSAFCLHCGKPIPTLPAVAPGLPVTAAPSPQQRPIIPAAQQKAPVSEEAIRKIKELLSQGSKILAVKNYRDETGADLTEAKNFVEAIEADMKTAHPVAVPTTPPVVPVTPIASAVPPATSVATQPTGVPVTTVPPVPAAVPPAYTSGELVYTDWVLEFPLALRRSLSVGFGGRGAPSVEEVRQRIWLAYQEMVPAMLQKWIDQGWQPIDRLGPSCLEMRVVKSYRDKNLLYWILMIVATPFTAGISLLVALLPHLFLEPTRFVVKMRAARGTRIPELPIMPAS